MLFSPDDQVENSSSSPAVLLKRVPGGRPLLKWPGGKRELVPELLQRVPLHFGRYFEPFLGGGALFFALQPEVAFLADANAELINCYIQVRDRPEKVIAQLATLKNTRESYHKVRGELPAGEVESAARLLFLTSLSFNGIYRLNLRGRFNVPYGHKTHLDPGNPDPIRAASSALSSATLQCGDFEEVAARAVKGDLVYLDPPYTVAHGHNGFLKYNDKIFSWDDQKRLARVASDLAQKGCHVIVTNADHESIHRLYEGFRLAIVKRFSRIAASRDYRRETTECIFFSEV